jgi:hypothetical protein
MSIDYTQQKLWEAVNALIGTGSLQERLRFAGDYLSKSQMHLPAFPAMPALERRLNEVLEQLARAGSIEDTTRALNDEDAQQIASKILSLFCEATRAARTPVGVIETLNLPGDVH